MVLHYPRKVNVADFHVFLEEVLEGGNAAKSVCDLQDR